MLLQLFFSFQDSILCYCVISGGNRYIPTGGCGGPSRPNVADPFTGASRYVPSHSDAVTGV